MAAERTPDDDARLKAAIERAQELVRRYASAGEGVVDELIRERREEAARE